MAIPFMADYKISFFTASPGGFTVYGILIAIVYKITNGKAPNKKKFGCEGCPSAKYCTHAACINESVKEEG